MRTPLTPERCAELRPKDNSISYQHQHQLTEWLLEYVDTYFEKAAREGCAWGSINCDITIETQYKGPPANIAKSVADVVNDLKARGFETGHSRDSKVSLYVRLHHDW